jgi:AAA domain
MLTFKPAVRTGSRVIITAYAESGGGKTLSLLRLGRGLVGPKGKLAMIDTESGRGKIYAAAIPGGYDYAELTPPFSPERYIEAIDDAEAAGYDALVLDSGSHEWDSIGGVLDIAESGDNASKRGLAKWAMPKAKHKRYVKRLLRSNMHLLIGLRAKEKFVQIKTGDKIPEGMKVGDIVMTGLIPIQDKSFVFETTIQLFFPTGATRGVPSLRWPEFKCPGDLEGAFPEGEQISERTGEMIAQWVAGGAPVDRELSALRTEAETIAERGAEPLANWWKSIGGAKQRRLVDVLDNLKSIAAAADRDRSPLPDNEFVAAITAALTEATAFEDVDAVYDAHAAIIHKMTPEEWAPLQKLFDDRRADLGGMVTS